MEMNEKLTETLKEEIPADNQPDLLYQPKPLFNTDKRDIIFSFFIEHEVFDMIEIDIALEEHGLPCFIE